MQQLLGRIPVSSKFLDVDMHDDDEQEEEEEVVSTHDDDGMKRVGKTKKGKRGTTVGETDITDWDELLSGVVGEDGGPVDTRTLQSDDEEEEENDSSNSDDDDEEEDLDEGEGNGTDDTDDDDDEEEENDNEMETQNMKTLKKRAVRPLIKALPTFTVTKKPHQKRSSTRATSDQDSEDSKEGDNNNNKNDDEDDDNNDNHVDGTSKSRITTNKRKVGQHFYSEVNVKNKRRQTERRPVSQNALAKQLRVAGMKRIGGKRK